jgi:hypothetical protein
MVYGKKRMKRSDSACSKKRRRLVGKRRNSARKQRSLPANVGERLQIKESS